MTKTKRESQARKGRLLLGSLFLALLALLLWSLSPGPESRSTTPPPHPRAARSLASIPARGSTSPLPQASLPSQTSPREAPTQERKPRAERQGTVLLEVLSSQSISPGDLQLKIHSTGQVSSTWESRKLAPGRHRFEVALRWSETEKSPPCVFEIRREPNRQRTTKLEVPAGGCLRIGLALDYLSDVEVVFPEPLSSISLEARSDVGGQGQVSSDDELIWGETLTDFLGSSCRVTVAGRDALKRWRYGFGESDLTAGSGRVLVKLQKASQLKVRVVDPSGRPVAASVSLRPAPPLLDVVEPFELEEVGDPSDLDFDVAPLVGGEWLSSGNLLLADLAPGTWNAIAVGTDRRWGAAEARVDLQSGATRALTLKFEVAPVTLVDIDPPPAPTASIALAAPPGTSLSLDSPGRLKLNGLAAGSRALLIVREGSRVGVCEVLGGRRTLAQVGAPASLRVQLRDTQGRLVKWGDGLRVARAGLLAPGAQLLRTDLARLGGSSLKEVGPAQWVSEDLDGDAELRGTEWWELPAEGLRKEGLPPGRYSICFEDLQREFAVELVKGKETALELGLDDLLSAPQSRRRQ